ncbi:MAG: hypothetical protein IH987_09715 [Planctomycetes bacterium]|nr:hypothetical protein [Planctomycetota bacterium]
MPQALDHDPPPKNKLVPFGVLILGTGLLTLIFGKKECSDFWGDCMKAWWTSVRSRCRNIRRLVIYLDNGPKNSGVTRKLLRRIVEFLNSQMDPAEVLAVEIKQFTGDSLKTLVPRVIGQTAEAERRRGRSARPIRQWDEASFFVELERVGGAELCAIARRILDWAVPRATRIAWGTGGTAASLIPILRHADANHHLFNMHTGFGSSPPSIELQFQHHANKPPFNDHEKRIELLRRFNEIHGVSLPDDAIDGRPKIRLAQFTDDDVLEQFFAAMQWFVDEVRRS